MRKYANGSRVNTAKRAQVLSWSILLYVCSIVVPHAANAGPTYTCYSGGMPGDSFSVSYFNVNATWESRFDTARSRWNNSIPAVNISYSNSSNSSITANSYSASWYGLYSPSGSGASKTFGIKINTRTLENKAPSGKFSTWALSTSTHEFGHSVRLPDNGATNQNTLSLMRHDRDRSVIGTPQPYDISNFGAC